MLEVDGEGVCPSVPAWLSEECPSLPQDLRQNPMRYRFLFLHFGNYKNIQYIACICISYNCKSNCTCILKKRQPSFAATAVDASVNILACARTITLMH